MSAWQRWQASDFIKYCEGMLTSYLVCAELGKNFPPESSPSRSMLSGGISGLTMRLVRASRQPTSRTNQSPPEMAKVASTREANRNAWRVTVCPNHPFEWSQSAKSNNTPRMQRTIWAYSQFQ